MEIRNNLPPFNYNHINNVGSGNVGGGGGGVLLNHHPTPAASVIPPTMPPQMIPMIPPGLQALYNRCADIYPDQPNPLQVTAVVKFWLGGPDPLDYISLYYNKGDEENNVPPHWHYISFGLSDLHGDGRVHRISDATTPSGFGFELTFRLKKEPNETSPPTWPAAVMQALAKYVFQTNNILCSGDHVSWHCSLDNSESRIQHMLMTEDSQLGTVQTVFGPVTFIQIVGVCLEELQAAQQWNGLGIIDLMKSVPCLGGPFLITDMRRGETIFEIDPDLREAVDDGIATQGSNLSGVSARCSFITKNADHEDNCNNIDDDDDDDHSDKNINHDNSEISNERNQISTDVNENEKLSNNNNNSNNDNNQATTTSTTNRHSSMSVSHDRNSCMSYASETGNNEPFELIQTKYFDSIHLKFNYEAGVLLPLALRGRLKHGRHFTFKNIQGNLAITFVTKSVSGSFVNYEQPYALHGPWLQVLIPDDHIDILFNELENVEYLDKESLPITYEWEKIKLTITLLPEE